jgi:CRISPR-associated endoribonuclease Cas6
MQYYQLQVSLNLKQALHFQKAPEIISELIKNALGRGFENSSYVFSNLGKANEKGLYEKKGKFYLRSFEKNVVQKLASALIGFNTELFEIKDLKLKNIKKDFVKALVTYNPVFVQKDNIFWTFMKDGNIENFKKMIQEDLIEKYEKVFEEKLEHNDFFAHHFEIKNEKPFTFWYKGLKYFGYKLFLLPKEDEISQKLAFIALGNGLGHKNTEVGGGFCNRVKKIIN